MKWTLGHQYIPKRFPICKFNFPPPSPLPYREHQNVSRTHNLFPCNTIHASSPNHPQKLTQPTNLFLQTFPATSATFFNFLPPTLRLLEFKVLKKSYINYKIYPFFSPVLSSILQDSSLNILPVASSNLVVNDFF